MSFDRHHFASPAAQDADLADAEHDAAIALADRLSAHGPLPVPCETCHGDGTVDFNHSRDPQLEQTVRCPTCHGSGTR